MENIRVQEEETESVMIRRLFSHPQPLETDDDCCIVVWGKTTPNGDQQQEHLEQPKEDIREIRARVWREASNTEEKCEDSVICEKCGSTCFTKAFVKRMFIDKHGNATKKLVKQDIKNCGHCNVLLEKANPCQNCGSKTYTSCRSKIHLHKNDTLIGTNIIRCSDCPETDKK